MVRPRVVMQFAGKRSYDGPSSDRRSRKPRMPDLAQMCSDVQPSESSTRSCCSRCSELPMDVSRSLMTCSATMWQRSAVVQLLGCSAISTAQGGNTP